MEREFYCNNKSVKACNFQRFSAVGASGKIFNVFSRVSFDFLPTIAKGVVL